MRHPVWKPHRALLRLVPIVLLGGLLLACGSGDAVDLPTEPASAPDPSPDPRQPVLPAGVEPIQFDTLAAVFETAAGLTFTLDLEIADTFTRRTRGLMYRTRLSPDAGMLFAFPEETAGPFWNRDTPLDLDIAFLDPEGRVIEILQLNALSTDLIAPELPYLYALEMESGWFAANGVRVADRLFIPEGIAGLPE